MFSNEMWSIVGPALVVGLMIAITHAPLGIEVVKRGIIFIDLAVAQIAGLGLIAAEVLIEDPSLVLIQLIALGSAVLAGTFFRKVEIYMPDQQEAVIGVAFILAASLSLILIANSPHGGDDIQHLLAGELLFVTWKQVMFHGAVYALILTVWFLRPAQRTGISFYLLFALTITSSVQLVGVYVVFASLILPALAAVGAKRPYLVSWFCGISSILVGMVLTLITDYPAGPVIVVAFVLMTIFWVAGTKHFSRR